MRWGTKEEKRSTEREVYRTNQYIMDVTLPNEEWRDCSIIGLADYLVSTIGRIYSMKTGKILLGNLRPDGYLKVDVVQISGKGKISIHKIVCRTFHGESPDPSYTVDHIDRNKSNNAPSNLRWASRSEQNRNKDPCKFALTVARIRDNKIIQIYEEEDAFFGRSPEKNFLGTESQKVELFEVESLIIPNTGMIFEGDLWIYENLTNLDFNGELWGSLNIDDVTVDVSNMGKRPQASNLGHALHVLGRIKAKYGKTIGYTNNEGYKSIKFFGKSELRLCCNKLLYARIACIFQLSST